MGGLPVHGAADAGRRLVLAGLLDRARNDRVRRRVLHARIPRRPLCTEDVLADPRSEPIGLRLRGQPRRGSSPSTPTTAPSTPHPSNTGLPTISGNNYPTATLTATNGTWGGSPTSYSYQWRQCDSGGASCANISGATNQTYVQQAADAGKTIRVVVTATNAGGSTPAVSSPTPVVNGVPANTALPTISGTVTQGQTLTAANGTWSGSPTSYAYQWRRCDNVGANCADIATATLQTYVVQLADVGQTLRVAVTATSPAGSGSASSAATAVVQAIPNNDPLNPPTISGQPYLGQTLTANNGVWNPAPTSFGYQWRRCDNAGADCADIGGSTSQTYVAQAADVGKTLRVVVTGTNANGSGNATSAQTSVISDAPSIDLGNPPSISGKAPTRRRP